MSQWPDNKIPATGNGLPEVAGIPTNGIGSGANGAPANGSGGSILSFEAHPGFDASTGGFRKIVSVRLRAEARTADLVRSCPDREWKTFCLLATRADERGLARLGEDEIANLLGTSLAAARARVRALEVISFEGRPLIKVKRDRLRDDEHTYVLYTVNFLPLPPQFYQEELFPRTDDEVRAAMEIAHARTEAAVAAAAVAAPAIGPVNGSGPAGRRMAAVSTTGGTAGGPATAPGVAGRVADQATGASVPDRRLRNVYTFAEERLGRPLSSKEILAVQAWAEEYGFPQEVIKALFDEGLTRGKSHLSYLEAVARRWQSEGIRSLADVERSREEYREATDQYAAVISYLNLGRRLTQAEIELLDKWYKVWGFPPEVILKACSTTVNISNPNFRYIDRVLSNWRRDGVLTLPDAERTLADFGLAGGAGGSGGGGGTGGAAGTTGASGGTGGTATVTGAGGQPGGSGNGRSRSSKGRPLKHYQMTDSGRDEEFYDQFLTRFDKTGKDK